MKLSNIIMLWDDLDRNFDTGDLTFSGLKYHINQIVGVKNDIPKAGWPQPSPQDGKLIELGQGIFTCPKKEKK